MAPRVPQICNRAQRIMHAGGLRYQTAYPVGAWLLRSKSMRSYIVDEAKAKMSEQESRGVQPIARVATPHIGHLPRRAMAPGSGRHPNLRIDPMTA
jgi:hypothetical protein